MSDLKTLNIKPLYPEEGVHIINSNPLNSLLGFVYMGRWSPAEYYEKDKHAVYYNGSVYQALETHVSGSEFDETKWRVITLNLEGSSSIATLDQTVLIKANSYVEYDLTQYGVSAQTHNIRGANINVKVKDIDQSSDTYNMWINAEAVATYGIRDDRYVRIINHFEQDLEFHISVTVTVSQ